MDRKLSRIGSEEDGEISGKMRKTESEKVESSKEVASLK
jgi:hypothetical protein